MLNNHFSPTFQFLPCQAKIEDCRDTLVGIPALTSLTTQPQFLNGFTVNIGLRLAEIPQMTPPLTDHFK